MYHLVCSSPTPVSKLCVFRYWVATAGHGATAQAQGALPSSLPHTGTHLFLRLCERYKYWERRTGCSAVNIRLHTHSVLPVLTSASRCWSLCISEHWALEHLRLDREQHRRAQRPIMESRKSALLLGHPYLGGSNCRC